MRRMLVRVVSRVGITAVVAGGMSGCFLADGQERVVVYGVAEPVRTLVVQGHIGEISVRGGGPAVRVTERQTYRGAAPVAVHSTVDGTLTLTYSCPDDGCGVGYEVEVPAGTQVRVSNGTGGVALAGALGAVEARTGTGEVTASGLASPTARLETETGGVSAAFAVRPESVRATSQTGGVRVRVPGGAPYAVEAGARTGDVSVTVARDDAAPQRITARTETGSVTVSGA